MAETKKQQKLKGKQNGGDIYRDKAVLFAQTVEVDGEVFLLDKYRSLDTHAVVNLIAFASRSSSTYLDILAKLNLGKNFSAAENSTDDFGVCAICERTLRPWTVVDGRRFEELAVEKYGVGQVPVHKLALDFVIAKKRLPDPDRYVEDLRAMLALVENGRKNRVLPVSIVEVVKEVCSQLKNAAAKLSIDEVVEIIRRGHFRSERARMEAGIQARQI